MTFSKQLPVTIVFPPAINDLQWPRFELLSRPETEVDG
jgi:hypothetical protein